MGQPWRPRTKRFLLIVTAIALVAVICSSSLAQTPTSTPDKTTGLTGKVLGGDLLRVENLLSAKNTTDLATGVIKLDGRKLFTIAAPAISDKNRQQNTPAPIEQRVSSIEQRLERLVQSNIDASKIQVQPRIDSGTGLSTIYVNGQYLLTVTPQDLAIQSTDAVRWTRELNSIIRTALVRAKQERQPQYLSQQALVAGGIVFLILVGHLIASRWQYLLKRHPDTASGQNILPLAPGEAQKYSVPEFLVRQELQHWQQYHFVEVQTWLLQVAKYIIWVGGCFQILGLFPYTRWFQPLIITALQVPLKILAISLGCYLAVQVSFILIEQFFSALKNRKFLPPGASQRLALRASTFTRVLQSVAAITVISIGVLASLSVVGVDLMPLLAGAGVIGLVISFASQNLIKDAINGFLILLEDQYGVGDVIMVGEMVGLVEYMNLRITQLRNSEGRLITIPNGAISIVQNLSKDWSRIDLAVDVSYGTNPDEALQVIQQVTEEIYSDRNWGSKIIEPPEILGIDEIDASGMLIRIWIKTHPLQQWSVAREFRRRLKLHLDQQEIVIEIPKQAVWFGNLMTLVNEQNHSNS